MPQVEMEMDEQDRDAERRPRPVRGQQEDGEHALVYWRTLPADRLREGAKQSLLDCISHISATSDEWRRAIRGEAAAAVSLALRLETPANVTYRVDLVMTLLVRTAIDDAAAATVMAHRLNAMPLAFKTRSKLATSWLLHCIWLGSRRRRQAPRRIRGDEGPASNGNDPQ